MCVDSLLIILTTKAESQRSSGLDSSPQLHPEGRTMIIRTSQNADLRLGENIHLRQSMKPISGHARNQTQA